MSKNHAIDLPWEGPQLPDYFEGRDGGMTTLGAFWRHSDQLTALSVELAMGRHPDFLLNQDGVSLPLFGPLSYVARGLVFISHDHPALSCLGRGAITDGNLVLIHRGLVEALNIESYQDPNGHDHLLAFMAQATQAITEKILGIDHLNPDDVDVLGEKPLSITRGLTGGEQLLFVEPTILHAALTLAYAGSAGMGAINEICDRTDSPSEHIHKQRTRARVTDAVGMWKDTTQHVLSYYLNNPPNQPTSNYRHGQDVAKLQGHLERYQHILAWHEKSEQNGTNQAFEPMPVQEIEKMVFFQGPSATYSIHRWLHSFHKNHMPVEQLGEICGALKNAEEAIFIHAAQGEFSRDTHKDKDGLQRKQDIGQYILTQPWANASMRAWLIHGASSLKKLGYAGRGYQNETHFRNVAAASLLEISDAKLASKKIGSEVLTKSIEIGGDAIDTRSNMIRYAGIVGVEQDEVYFTHGSLKHASERFDSLTTNYMGEAILHCAQNRHALALLSKIFERHDFEVQATTPNGETVAHLLMKHIHKKNAGELESVLVQLLNRGLDPMARDIDGFLAGEGTGKQACLVDHSHIVQAVSLWQQQTLHRHTQRIAGSSRKRRL